MEKKKFKIGEHIMVYSDYFKEYELGRVSGYTADGKVAYESIPGVGSIIFDGVEFSGEADEDICTRVSCRSCNMKMVCLKKFFVRKQRGCKKYLKHMVDIISDLNKRMLHLADSSDYN